MSESVTTYDGVEVPGYHDRHALCPRCRSPKGCESTTSGFLNGPDINRAWCVRTKACGWRGFVNDLVPLAEAKRK